MSTEIQTRMQRIVFHTNASFDEVKEAFEKEIMSNPKQDAKRSLDRVFGRLLGLKHRKSRRRN